jgi:hypothetical protein
LAGEHRQHLHPIIHTVPPQADQDIPDRNTSVAERAIDEFFIVKDRSMPSSGVRDEKIHVGELIRLLSTSDIRRVGGKLRVTRCVNKQNCTTKKGK